MPPATSGPALRDPTWLRARLTTLLDLVDPTRPKHTEAPDRAVLSAPITAEERALCVHAHELAIWSRLTAEEADLLALCAAACWVPPLDGLLDSIKMPTRAGLLGVLARTLDVPVRAVRQALRDDGVLTALAELSVEGERPVGLRLDPECSPVADLGAPDLTTAEIVATMLDPGPPASLPLSAHAHLGTAVDAALRLLRGAMASGTPGVHVLLHGPPGLGKTELARALAAEIAERAVEVPFQWTDGRAMQAVSRLQGWNRLQRLLAGDRASVIVFDEAEDAMDGLDRQDPERRDRLSKAALTRQIEQSPRPTLWIANDVANLDGAYLRRFTQVIDVRPPPSGVRRSLADRLLAPLGVGDAVRAALGEHPDVSPALLGQAAQALTLVAPDARLDPDTAVCSLLRGHLRRPLDPRPAAPPFDPGLLELSGGLDVDALITNLGATEEGRLLLHGPPGTGKSAFARHLADVTGRPLHLKTAADLLSCWVGGTEANLARAFADATADGGILVFDEADALLFPRASARASWEGSQIAQTLVEIERFTGILVATTNLMPRIDEAFHRRFDVIAEVRAPGPDRRRRLIEAVAAELGLDPPSGISGLEGLAPGHVAQLRRRWRLTGPPSDPAALLRDLTGALGRRTSVGFRDPGAAPRIAR